MYKSIKIYTRTRCQVSVYRTTGPLVLALIIEYNNKFDDWLASWSSCKYMYLSNQAMLRTICDFWCILTYLWIDNTFVFSHIAKSRLALTWLKQLCSDFFVHECNLVLFVSKQYCHRFITAARQIYNMARDRLSSLKGSPQHCFKKEKKKTNAFFVCPTAISMWQTKYKKV